MNDYLITEWALIRRNELVDIPKTFSIHSDFLHNLSSDEFEGAFREIHEIFHTIYTDMSENPDRFGLPLYDKSEVEYFSKEAREVRALPWMPFFLLMYLFAYSQPKNGVYVTNTEKVRFEKKIKKTNQLLKVLGDYGFVFSGVKNSNLSSAPRMEIDYPDNRNVLEVLYLAANKVIDTQLKNVKNHMSNMSVFSNAFISWNYKLFTEPVDSCTIGNSYDYVSDKMHRENDKAVIAEMDSRMIQKGFTRSKGDPNEGPSLRYYRTKSAYDFALSSDKGVLVLELRIRNAEKCLNYLKECSDEIIEMFRYTDQGCENRVNGTCKYGVKYEFEGKERWHCGCCGAPFKVQPLKENIEYYFKLVELGNKK